MSHQTHHHKAVNSICQAGDHEQCIGTVRHGRDDADWIGCECVCHTACPQCKKTEWAADHPHLMACTYCGRELEA